MSELTAVILTAEEGKRMRSRLPKVLHRLCGRPLVAYPLRAARAVTDRLVMVIGPHMGDLSAVVSGDVELVEQAERLGTGHALRQARAKCGDGAIVVLPGDAPLLSALTLERLVAHHAASRAAATVLTAIVDRPHGYGRILRYRGRVAGIVEHRDATPDQKAIGEINTSVYAFDARRLWPALDKVRAANDQGEYYLTDVIGVLARAGQRIEGISLDDPREALRISDRKQLAAVAAVQRLRILDRLMEEGVTIVDPATTYIEDTVTVGPDTVIHPNVLIEADTAIGSECVIGAGCQLSRSRLDDRVVLRPYCVIAESTVEAGAVLGPFCHLRPQSHVEGQVHIGNFVERPGR